MKITKISAYLLPRKLAPSGWMHVKPLLFVKVQTDEGVHGWGEAYTLAHRELAELKIIESIARFAIGSDPFDIKAFVNMAQIDIAERRPGIDFFCAQSAIEIALWDILGKQRGKPVRELLGGVERDTLMLYANLWSNEPKTPAAVIEKVAEAAHAGFGAVKIYPFNMASDLVAAAKATRDVCRRISGEVEVFLDCSRRMNTHSTLDFVTRLGDAPIAWLEEPVSSRYLGQLAEINHQVSLPVVTGESLCGVSEFEPVMNQGAADILNPDVAACGGIAELKEIADLAQSYSVRISPHNYNSMSVGLAATGQVSAVLSNFMIAEYFEDHALAWPDLCETDAHIEAGFLHLGKRPGLGIEPDEAKLAAEAVEIYQSAPG